MTLWLITAVVVVDLCKLIILLPKICSYSISVRIYHG